MTFPEPGTVITFAEAQAAVAAVSDAFENAINENIEDKELRTRVLAAAAGNVFHAMMSRAVLAGEANDHAHLSKDDQLDTDVLFNRLFGGS